MRSLFQNVVESRLRIRQTAALSIALHAAILLLIVVGSIRVRRTVIFRPMIQGSAQQVAVVAVGRGALASVLAAEHAALPEKSIVPRTSALRHQPSAPEKRKSELSPSQPPNPLNAESSAGRNNPGITGDGSDTQSMYPAYPTLSPSPQVKDRSLLPPTDQKVIVDVDLGADGHVQNATLLRGLNNTLDQIVLDTVRGWQFHPAMVNGQPVSSRMELVFPFNKDYPAAD
jgi:TonB family protein